MNDLIKILFPDESGLYTFGDKQNILLQRLYPTKSEASNAYVRKITGTPEIAITKEENELAAQTVDSVRCFIWNKRYKVWSPMTNQNATASRPARLMVVLPHYIPPQQFKEEG